RGGGGHSRGSTHELATARHAYLLDGAWSGDIDASRRQWEAAPHAIDSGHRPGPRRARRHRRPERFLPGRRTRGRRRRRRRSGVQCADQAVRARRAHAGLAPARSPLVRQLPPGALAVRDDRPRLRRADPVARSLRAGHHRGGAARRPGGDAGGVAGAQGLPAGDRLVFGVLRERSRVADRPGRLPSRARLHARLPVRVGHRLLRRLVGARCAQVALRRGSGARRMPGDRSRRLARAGACLDARGRRVAGAKRRTSLNRAAPAACEPLPMRLRGAAPLLVAALASIAHAAEGAPPRPAALVNSLGMRFVLVPAGEFLMGSDESPQALAAAYPDLERRRFDELADEAPVHRVRITRAFYRGQNEVTVGQFRRFVERSGYVPESIADGTGGYGYDPAY